MNDKSNGMDVCSIVSQMYAEYQNYYYNLISLVSLP